MNAVEQKVTFKQETITISVQKDDGKPFKQDREAHVAYMDGKRIGLAYLTDTDTDGEICYSVTHIGSGLNISRDRVGTEVDTRKWIELCLEFADCTGEKPRITSPVRALMYAVIGALQEA